MCANTQWNKKVLLRERKRHTARCVASPWGGGGLPTLAGGVPTLGYPFPLSWPGQRGTYLGQGVPTMEYSLPPSWPGWGDTYLEWGGGGVPTLGYPLPVLTWLGGGVPTLVRVPLSPGVDRQLWIQYLPVVLRTREVIINKSNTNWLRTYRQCKKLQHKLPRRTIYRVVHSW